MDNKDDFQDYNVDAQSREKTSCVDVNQIAKDEVTVQDTADVGTTDGGHLQAS